MESSKSGKGAYAPVTIPMEEKDGSKVMTAPQGGQQGFCTRTKLFIASVVVVVVVIIIIILAVTLSKNEPENIKGETPVTGTGVTGIDVTSPGPPPPPVTTTGPTPTQATTTPAPAPVPGSFSGTVTIAEPYYLFYDDPNGPEYRNLATTFTNAMSALYGSAAAPITELYHETRVVRMSQNGTNVDIHFTVTVSAIQQGARDYLVGQLYPLPSSSLDTYDTLWADIEEEKPIGDSN